ncbi:MAG: beta-ketoacyl-[acyl-carrier-protein] synthase family protein [Actinomycetota bacterium]|nr:beta-ketoacyl-[acyl-carrier-protein] synthase family protein [Actinomycetota bacterium]
MIESRLGRRVAITGLGVLAPCGIGVGAFWEGLMHAPEPAVVRRVPRFEPSMTGLSHQQARRLDRFAQLALAAAAEAMADAGLSDGGGDPDRSGVVLGTGIGGAQTWEDQVHILTDRGERMVSPLTVPMVMPNAAAAAVSMRWGWRGPCETITTACASGTHAVAAGARLVASGRVDRVLVGGSESCQTDTNLAAFTNMRALSPTGISRPFDPQRDGFCNAEAAAVLVLEDLAAAQERGAAVYAEVAGAASTSDAHHITAPAPGGAGAAACMRLAIADAGLAAAEITHVNAHGTSTQLNDAAEAAAIGAVFGAHRPVVTSIKGVTGHSLGAAGAVEAVALALTFARGLIPPTVAVSTVDPEIDLDVALSPRAWVPAPAISNSFAFGGHNGCVVFLPV